MDGHEHDDDLVRRLSDLGTQPIPDEVAAGHRASMAEGAPGTGRFRFGWRAVAGAAIAGFLAGSTGLAAAGTLPDPAQDVAHDVLARVGIDVPRSTEGCPEGQTFRNHGEYVSSVEAAGGDVEAASRSDCGMPLRGGGRGGGNGQGNGGGGREPGTPRPDTDGDPCTGPPPWAGAHLPAEQRRALQDERQARCGEDLDDAETEAPATEAPAPEETVPEETVPPAPAPEETVPEETTTTVG